MVKIGLERIVEERPSWLKDRRLGLLCHQASVTRDGQHARIILQQCFGKELRLLFSPQHGLFGDKQANMISSTDFIDKVTGLPVISLYGPRLRPEAEHLSEIEVLLIDLQDVGCRVYTYIWTMLLAMEACAQTGVEVVILDRPNPLGFQMEGPILEEGLFSFVGLAQLPLRHGLTMGELARYFLAKKKLALSLRIIEMEGWQGEFFPETGLPWIMPSPNMPLWETALVYPGQVLLEGTNLSEGRGTTRPFEIFGAPYLSPDRVKLSLLEIPGVRWHELAFTPTFDKWEGKLCYGFRLEVYRPYLYEPVFTSLVLLKAIIETHEEFFWRRPPYEFEWQQMPFDIIVGAQDVRAILQEGSKEDLKNLCQKGVREFQEEIESFRIYNR